MTDRKDGAAREEPVSRRRLLGGLARAGAIGAGAAVLGGAVTAEPALAGTDGDVVLGVNYQSTTYTTGVLCSGAGVAALLGQGDEASGTGVNGHGHVGVVGDGTYGVIGNGVQIDPVSVGVYGSGSTNGVEGRSSNNIASGVYGQNDGTGYGVAWRSGNGTGVLGDTVGGVGVRGTATSGTGIFGHSDSTKGIYGEVTGTTGTTYGVHARSASTAGAAVLAQNTKPDGTGLQVIGKSKFSRSGKLTIAAGTTSITKTGIPLTASSFVLATLQRVFAGDVWIKAAVPNVAGSSITIYLNKTVPANTPVAWFVVN